MRPIISEMFHDTVLSVDESELLYSKIKRTDISKGEFLLQAGQEINEIFYVHTGCLRSYFLDLEGKEHTLQFAVKGWWISDYIALWGGKKIKAVSYIECIKDTILYRVSKSDFDNFCQDIPNVGRFNTQKMELAFASFQNRILENLTLSAKERYMNFVAAYPTIESNVKNYHIASFLGITTESLSRIRREIASS